MVAGRRTASFEVLLPAGVGLRAKSKDVLPFALASLTVYNLGVISESVPLKVFQEWGLDLDRWYPMHRLMYGQSQGPDVDP